MAQNMGLKKRILYIEDEQWLMGGVIDSLSVGFEVIPARNADQGLTILKNDSKIQLVILDIMLPPGNNLPGTNRGRRTGIEIAKIIRNEMRLKIPIIFYTVVTDPAVYKELREIGVQEIISKKELPSELERIVQIYLKK
jgi:CheY-like chemotaxis protein